MANSRNYSNTAVSTTLNGAITNVGTNVVLSSQTGMPTPPFVLSLEPDTASEELVLVTSGAGTGGSPYVVTRGYDGTSGAAHASLVTVQHRISAIDFTDSRTHEATGIAVHGLANLIEVVGSSSALSTNTVVSNTLSETTLGKSFSIGGTTLLTQSFWRIYAFGTLACTGTPTLTIRLKYGANVLASNVLTFGSGLSSDFQYEGLFNIQSAGASGSISGSQMMNVAAASFTAGANIPDTQGLLTAINTTGSNAFTMTAQWSVASSSNIATCLGSDIEQVH